MDHRTRSLAALAKETASTRDHLGRAELELAAARERLVDAGLRVLIAETPLADLDRHRAARASDEHRERVRALRERLAALEADRLRMSRAVKPSASPVRRTA